jgi:hypothetical protein
VHNANEWLPDGRLFRPMHVSLWKTELILGISLAASRSPPVVLARADERIQ